MNILCLNLRPNMARKETYAVVPDNTTLTDRTGLKSIGPIAPDYTQQHTTGLTDNSNFSPAPPKVDPSYRNTKL